MSLNNLLYRIQRTSSEGVKVVHVDNLRKFEAKTMPSSWLETSSSLPPSTDGDQHSNHFAMSKEVDSRSKSKEGPCLSQGSKIFRLLVGYDIDLRILMIIAHNLICFVANLVIWEGGEWCCKYCIVSLFLTSLGSFNLAFVVSICGIQ